MATSDGMHHQQQSLSKLIVAAWVDQSMEEQGPNQSIKDQFEPMSALIDRWLYFNNADTFSNYVQRNTHVQLIAVMTGGMARELVPKHSNSNVLECVYVFCFDVGRARQNFADQPKVKGIFNIEEALYEKIVEDLSILLTKTGIALAEIDDRNQARIHYEEAKRLLSLPIKDLKDEEKRSRLAELDVRMDQLLA